MMNELLQRIPAPTACSQGSEQTDVHDDDSDRHSTSSSSAQEPALVNPCNISVVGIEEEYHESVVNAWAEMKLRLDEKIMPLDYAQTLYQKLHQLHQRSDQSVKDYTEQFYQLLSRVKLSTCMKVMTSSWQGTLVD
ncbi:hypothetical protein Acr_08g0015500 [Actinidia rufa]|uniref:Retrotransposon gag domain-containing protein n=1 Tax=Actinidia rufa TaxID=165716 RepID=A0A7J0F398_9ERIC|nr:hypothetical protein Acr_08g0015500 [Actinidia rufa]